MEQFICNKVFVSISSLIYWIEFWSLESFLLCSTIARNVFAFSFVLNSKKKKKTIEFTFFSSPDKLFEREKKNGKKRLISMNLGQWIPPDFWSVHSGSSKRLKYRFSSLICGSSQFHLSKNLKIENNDGKSEKNIRI